jgi:2-polyprenyl-3-methyl-5-hydroxy-6-metoxy-1,4-benzoquinol methylase
VGSAGHDLTVPTKHPHASAQDRASKARQRSIWALGNYHEFTKRSLWAFGPMLVEACKIGPGQRVLDVAAGTGNVAIRAAEAGADVIASDLTPENFAAGRREAAAHGVELEWVEADAEALPFADGEFDVVTSAFGAVFAPHHQVVADELLRVCRPGGTIGLATITRSEWSDEFFEIMSEVLPSMLADASPLEWGDEHHVAELFGDRVEPLDMWRRRFELERFANPAELCDFFKANHPVAIALYRELAGDPERLAALDRAFVEMIERWPSDADGESRVYTMDALMVVARKLPRAGA